MYRLADRVFRLLVENGVEAAHIEDGLCLAPGMRTYRAGSSHAVACWLGIGLKIRCDPEMIKVYEGWADIIRNTASDLVVSVCDHGVHIEAQL